MTNCSSAQLQCGRLHSFSVCGFIKMFKLRMSLPLQPCRLGGSIPKNTHTRTHTVKEGSISTILFWVCVCLCAQVPGEVRLNQMGMVRVVFMNPVDLTLKNCSLTLSGSGFFRHEFKHWCVSTRVCVSMSVLLFEETQRFTVLSPPDSFPELKPSNRITVTYSLAPYRAGRKTLSLHLECSNFHCITTCCEVEVKP